jgi:uncharacterized protein
MTANKQINEDEHYKNTIVYKKSETYAFPIEGYIAVYSQLARHGLSLLDKPSSFIFNLINNKRTVQDLTNEAQKKDKNVTISNIHSILVTLAKIDYISYAGVEGSEKPTDLTSSPKRLSAWLQLTNQCNLRCVYCFISKTPNIMTDEVAKKTITKLLIDGKKNNFQELNIIFSGGECMLEFKRIKKLLEFGIIEAKKLSMKILFTILTNGVLLTEESARFIKQNNIGIGVSLDGLEKYNDSQRAFSNGTGSFKYVEKGIKTLTKYNVEFSITITITSQNVKHIPQFIKYCIDNKISFHLNLYHENDFSPNDTLIIDEDILIPSLKKSLRYVYKHIHQVPLQGTSNIFGRIDLSRPHLHACGVGRSYTTISHDGTIASCPMSIDYSIGSIKDNDVVQTMKTKSFMNSLKKPIINDVGECMKCRWRYVCSGGCPLAYIRNKKKPTYCRTYKAIIPELLKLEAKRLITYRGN